MSMLEIKNMNVFYGELQALFDITMQVKKGQTVSLMGANSAGKSTLLKTVLGLLSPASGTITFNREEITDIAPHKILERGIALVPEGRKIFTSLTVQENLLIGSYTPRARKDRNKNLEFTIDLFPQLRGRLKQKGTDLSGGEQQMLSIGRALMSQPKFIIFDEISLGLSPIVVKDLYRAVKRINDEGMTVVLVEQDVKRSLKVADFAYILQEGKITLEGDPRYFTEEKVKKAYFGI